MHFVISGRFDCPQYVYAVMIAQKLKENLPNFDFTRIPKKPNEYERWLLRICKENEWSHIKSPLIWKEIAMKKGKKYYVGNLDRFLDLCSNYYDIPKEALRAEHFEKGELKWFQTRSEDEYFEKIKLDANEMAEYRCRQICITGAASPITDIIIMELLQIPIQNRDNGMEIRLFDDAKREKKLQHIARDAKYAGGQCGLGSCRVVSDLKEALYNVDLVLVLDNFVRKTKESLTKWLKRNRNAMCALGKALNKYAHTHCRVILGGYNNQPLCYNATVLASFATKLHVRNIVAVTQDLGRELLPRISELTGVPLKDMYCPPIWGFVGMNKYVDMKNTLHNYHYKVPGPRLKSTLPQGTEEVEIRTMEYLIKDEKFKDFFTGDVKHKADSLPRLGRLPALAKATAIIDLLRLWTLEPEDGNGEILCLGVYSDGTFNIPKGIYWSQPVTLEKGFWVPFPDYPVPRKPDFSLHDLFLFSIASLYRTGVKPRFYYAPKQASKTKKTKKFDFEEIKKEIKMPVIKTEIECLMYLKKIAKEELGLDFDKEETIEELPEPEEPPKPPPQFWCECWKNQLKELQKEVFEKPEVVKVALLLSDYSSTSSSSGSGSGSVATFTEESIETYGSFRISQYLPPETSVHDTSSPEFNVRDLIVPEITTDSSSSITVCSCGSDCKCLPKKPSEINRSSSDSSSLDRESGESGEYAQSRVSQIFGEGGSLYGEMSDVHKRKKEVTFDPDLKSDGEKEKPQYKFYGMNDAIRDKSAMRLMEKRIRRYNRDGEESLSEIGEADEEGREGSRLQEQEMLGEEEESMQEEVIETKFHLSFQGAPYEILGDPSGLESLEGMRRLTEVKTSTESFKEFYSDQIRPSLQMTPSLQMSTDPDTRSISFTPSSPSGISTTEKQGKSSLESIPGEHPFPQSIFEMKENSSNASLKSFPGEIQTAQAYFEQYGEDLPDIIFSEGEEEKKLSEERKTDETIKPETATVKSEKSIEIKKQKWEGVPKCYLCRCIIPEGLLGCPCGETTVVEVFKKESEEVIVESDEEISFKVEYVEEKIREPKMAEVSIERIDKSEKVELFKNLPPESFLPFNRRRESAFHPPERPDELKKEVELDLYDIPSQCFEELRIAEDLFLKRKSDEEQYGEYIEGEETERFLEKDENPEEDDLSTVKEVEESEDEFEIKTQFSDLKMLTPQDIDDWQLMVRMKYRKWFLENPSIKDDFYYDIAIEEVSEDEPEIDEELLKYFEK